MGLWHAADRLGKQTEIKRIEKAREKEIADQAKAKADKDAQRHEENKRQGMI